MLDAKSSRERSFLIPAFRRPGERCNISISCPFITERAEIPFGPTGSDSAVGGHDLSHHRRFFGVAITLRIPQIDGRFRSGRQSLWVATWRTACPCSCVCSIGPSKECGRSRMLPSAPKPLKIWPRKWELRSRRSTLRPATAISWSSSIPPTATTPRNSRSRSARRGACEPALPAFGPSPNFTSWYPSCRNCRRETYRGGGTDRRDIVVANRPRWSRSLRRLGIRSRQEMFAFATRIRQSVTDRRVDAVQVVAGLVGRIYLRAVARKRDVDARHNAAHSQGVPMRVTNVFVRVRTACAGLLFATAALAQSPGYPDRPVKIIVPFAAAGPTDVVARLIALKLSEKFGQQFYIENMAGAGGNLGMGAGAKATADGYTILFVSSSYTVNPSLYAKPPYDPDKDFAPVTKAAGSPNGLFVNPKIG